MSVSIQETTDQRVSEITHEPWCTAHVDAGPEAGPIGWCSTATVVHGAHVQLAIDVEELEGRVEIYAPSDTWLSAAQAREVANAILADADKIDGAGLLALSVRDAAVKTGVSEYEIRNAINFGDLSAKRIGQRLIIPTAALAAWIQTLEDFPTT